MRIKTITREEPDKFDAAVNKALDEGWQLTDRRLIQTPAGTHDYMYAELVQLDPVPEPKAPPEIDLLAAARVIQRECHKHGRCTECPLNGICDNKQPDYWNLPEEAAP